VSCELRLEVNVLNRVGEKTMYGCVTSCIESRACTIHSDCLLHASGDYVIIESQVNESKEPILDEFFFS